MENNNEVCKVCGCERCIGKFLLHPNEVNLFVPRIKETELAVCPERTFKLVDSPSSGEIFTKFKELHIIAGPNEDLDNLPEVKVYVEDLIEKVREQNSFPADIDMSQFVGEIDHPLPKFELPEVIEEKPPNLMFAPVYNISDTKRLNKINKPGRSRPTKKKYRRKKK